MEPIDPRKYGVELIPEGSGAPARRLGEEGLDYVARALQEGPFRHIAHPGNLAYVWPTRRASRSTIQGLPVSKPYPKGRDTIVRMDW